ncbi:hydroxyacylglutathione hydrolase [Pseudosulfitobacter sp. SM2401]|uniref:hydroxyacylglutathione hydrolase n=1 Tax=Pseudosulfitobacter sp. SM2401 TaxID=3350098 RepID=UPI0036F1CEDE
MPLTVVTIPCLSDNYTFLLHDSISNETAVIDVPDAGPIKQELDDRGWRLTQIWLTHHHWDHVDGLPDLLRSHPAQVIGARDDTDRLPALDAKVGDGDTFTFAGNDVQVMDVSGHTIGHIAFHVPAAMAAFTADSLMALGCGRLFEGTPAQMFDSLSKLAALPDDTVVYSGHEYTAANATFAITIDPDNPDLIARIADITEKRAKGQPTVPSSLLLERATNPFLRGHDPQIQTELNMKGAAPVDVFAEIRARKDRF